VSRATLYQYFSSKEQLFVELIRTAAADLLRVIQRLGAIGPTVEGYDNLHWWLGEWAWVQDKYTALYLQWAVTDSPEASLRPLIAEHIVSYVSSLTPRLSAAIDDDFDASGVATVLLPLLFRMNDYRQKGMTRTLTDEEVLDGTATFVQLALFPSTTRSALAARTTAPRAPRPGRVRRASEATRERSERAPIPATVQRILHAGAETFAARGFHHSTVQDVLQCARVGRGTFYKYFDDKTDLLISLAEDCMFRLEELAGCFVDAIDADDSGRTLREWLQECLTLHRQYQGVFRALLHEESRHPVLEDLRRQSGGAILRIFDRALARVDRAYPFDVRVGSLLLLALLERGPEYAFGTDYDLSEARVVEVLAVLIERGLLDRTPPRSLRRPPRPDLVAS